MGLGYEGWVQVDSTYALGTGTSVPRARPRLESAAGYGGQIFSPPEDMGLGLPYNYDYDTYDGNIGFEASMSFYKTVVLDWIFDRQSAKEVQFVTRNAGSQSYDNCFWSNITLSASPEATLDGSIQFVALQRDEYIHGSDVMDRDGPGIVCPPGSGFPPTLNYQNLNLNPVPGWNTKVDVGSVDYEFLNWTLSFSQDVVKFFACEANTTAQEPKYLAVGPMTVIFSGQYMYGGGFLGDHLDVMNVTIGDSSVGDYSKLALKRCECSTEQDDMQPPDGLTTLDVEYQVYGLEIV